MITSVNGTVPAREHCIFNCRQYFGPHGVHPSSMSYQLCIRDCYQNY